MTDLCDVGLHSVCSARSLFIINVCVCVCAHACAFVCVVLHYALQLLAFCLCQYIKQNLQ